MEIKCTDDYLNKLTNEELLETAKGLIKEVERLERINDKLQRADLEHETVFQVIASIIENR